MKLKRNHFPVIFVLSVICFLSCHSRDEISQKLDMSEKIMDSSPDSALELLNEIEYSSLKNEKERSLFGLLYTMALDKNHLDPENDSLILPAAAYFKKKNDIPRLIKAEYYGGRVLYHRGEYSKALINFFKAKELGEKNEDEIFWAGMACRGISDIYNICFNSADELFYAEKEYENIKKSGRQPYINYALYDLSIAYNNNDESDKALDIIENILDSALKYEDIILYYEALRTKAFNLNWIEKYEESNMVYSEIFETPYSQTLDSLMYCINLIEEGKSHEASLLVDKISHYNKPYKKDIKYKIYKERKDYKNALNELEDLYKILNDSMRTAMNTNFISPIEEYFQLNKKYEEAENKISRFKLWIILILSFIIFSVLIMIFIYKNKRYKNELEEKLLILDNLKNSLERSKEEKIDTAELLKNIMGSQYELIEEIGEIIIRNSDSRKAQKQIIDRVNNLMDEFSISEERIGKIEKQVDSIYDNLIHDLKIDLPDLKKEDYLLFLYTVIGFSNPLITFFLKEEKIEKVYNRKRRLKDKINRITNGNKERYLSYL